MIKKKLKVLFDYFIITSNSWGASSPCVMLLSPLMVCFLLQWFVFVFVFQCNPILSWDLFPWESHVFWIMEAFLRGALFSPLLGPYKFSWLPLVWGMNLEFTFVPGESLGFHFLWTLFFHVDPSRWQCSSLLLQVGGQFFRP